MLWGQGPHVTWKVLVLIREKLHLSLIKHYAMKGRSGVEV
jgi:hypothetical protein